VKVVLPEDPGLCKAPGVRREDEGKVRERWESLTVAHRATLLGLSAADRTRLADQAKGRPDGRAS
jgi:hypothetical protein